MDIGHLIRRADLTPAQAKMWSDTRSALMWHAPAFSHIFYTMLQNNNQKGPDGTAYGAIFTDMEEIPIAATDGSNLVFNVGPKGFFRFNLNQRVFIVAHEILHGIFGHCAQGQGFRQRGKVSYPDGKVIDYDHEQMNIAQDYVINAALDESKLGEMPKNADGTQCGMLDANIATSKDNSLDTYRKIFKKNSGGKGGGFDVHLAPGATTGQDPVSAAAGRNQAQWDTELQSAISAARAMGKLPGSLDRLLGAMLEPQVDWKEKIRALFARRVGSGTFDWRRPDRRLITRDIYAPGRSGFGAGTVVVGVDTSGSIGAAELDMFMAEMAGILEDVRPQKLMIMWCDAKLHRTDEAEEVGDLNSIRAKGAPGGGGTSFIPVFEEIDKLGLQPEALVYLTDGLGSFPPIAPAYTVIWGNIYPNSKYPFGEVVDIPKQTGK